MKFFDKLKNSLLSPHREPRPDYREIYNKLCIEVAIAYETKLKRSLSPCENWTLSRIGIIQLQTQLARIDFFSNEELDRELEFLIQTEYHEHCHCYQAHVASVNSKNSSTYGPRISIK